ncbi:LCP family protein [Jeotgalibacillus marinus]|uniref:Regulatory protein MsrR n=1 Tax=Jeotgalibacillus marinus TaxID=86667 RepID=A0ABV3Q6L8_9BACL
METRKQLRKKRKKKRKKGRFFLPVMIFLIIGVFAYAGTQYWLGTQISKDAEALNYNFENEFQGVKNQDGKINVLLIGVDSRGEEQSRSDTMMIAQWDGKDDEINIVSLMRDIYVDIPEYSGYKLNTAFYLGGPELLRQTIKENFDVDVEHYMIMDFVAFESMIDALAPGGIQIDVEKAMSENIGVTLEPGIQHLNGQELLGYARFRADSEGDFGRVRRQQQAIEALKAHVISFNGVLKAPKLLGIAQPYIETNMTSLRQIEIMSRILLSGGGELQRLTVPLEGTYSDARYEGVGAVLELDWQKNNAALKEFLE